MRARKVGSRERESNAKNGRPARRPESAADYKREIAELRRAVDEQKERAANANAQVDALRSRERDLRETLFEAHDQLMKRDETIALAHTVPERPAPAAAIARVDGGSAPASGAFAPGTLPGKYLQYQQLLQRIRELIRDSRVSGNVLVISKGDEEMLLLGACKAAHFPQEQDGGYAGHYPADSGSAIEQVETLRRQGAQFLLIPQTAMWWLEHYGDFGKFLNERCERVIDQPEICLLFNLLVAPKAVSRGPATVSGSSAPRPFGVNVCGHLRSEKGLGSAVRSQIRSLRAANVPIVLNDYPDDHAANSEDEFQEFSEDNPYAVNLIHINADSLRYFVEKRRDYLRDHYNIGYWAWETPVFPKQWWDSFNHLDEIWVGSDFVLDAISRVSPIPVVKVLLAIPDRLSADRLPRSHFGLPSKAFVFLFAFDFMSVAQRKNPLGLVEAFRKAFGKRDDAMLVLKCGHPERHPDDAKQLERACKGANIKIIDTNFSRHEMTSLMRVSDCYVSLHRSEGFGLTLAEAMSLEKPVIATGFSGNMDFMHPGNSYPVNYAVTRIDEDYGPYRGGLWAEPDVDHAAELMKFVFKNRAAARKVGSLARQDVLRTLSEQRIGALMRDRLLRIASHGRIAAPAQPEVEPAARSAKEKLYGQLLGRVRRAVEKSIPEKSHILVVSKGDDQLTRFRKRSAAHFPQGADGQYAGHHPADSATAINAIEALRMKGVEYLVFPQTAFWWFDYYQEFQAHLHDRCLRIWNDADCVIYQLVRKKSASSRPRKRSMAAAR